MKIVVRMPNWLGDAVLALPALRAIISHFSGAEIWVAVTSRSLELFETEPGVTGVLEVPEPIRAADVWRMSRRWRHFKFDLAILLTNSFGSALVAALAKIPERWGYKTDGRSWLLTKGVARKPRMAEGVGKRKGENHFLLSEEADFWPLRPEAEHQVLYYLRLLQGLGLKVPAKPEISLNVSDDEREMGRRRLAASGLDPLPLRTEKRPLIVLNPGASYGPAKRWPAARFGSVAAGLEKSCGGRSIIIGSAEEEKLAREVVEAAMARGISQPPVVLTGKTTLRELAGILSWASLMITNDTGPMHLANALGVPVVALFGPTDPRVTGPWHEPYLILQKRVICWPCWYRSCPYDHSCLKLISEDEVLSASLSLLQPGERMEAKEK
jgi:heptosyltransferase-2